MANINIHYTGRDETVSPNVQVDKLSATGTHVVRICEPGADSVTLFFENVQEVANFVDKLNQGLTAFLIARGDE